MIHDLFPALSRYDWGGFASWLAISGFFCCIDPLNNRPVPSGPLTDYIIKNELEERPVGKVISPRLQ